jgi:hypothetical protein
VPGLTPPKKSAAAPQRLEVEHFPAPTGGLNTVDAASEMPQTDAAYVYNLIRGQLGLRTRQGYQEWCTGLSGNLNGNQVRTIMPFLGAAAGQVHDKLFAVTPTGVYDCTTSFQTPGAALLAFGNSIDPAGFSSYCSIDTAAGRFLVSCDEQNGIDFVWSEAAGSKVSVLCDVTALWDTNLFIAVGTQVVNGNKVYICVTSGTTAGSGGGPTGTSTGISDGSVTWNYVKAAITGNVIGPSIDDQNNGLQLGAPNLTSLFAFVMVWKGRVWYVESNSSRAWYTDVNAIFGTVTSFDFGYEMRSGGNLLGLYTWSFDGGSGPDARLVGVGSSGDIVIYQGTDPTSASTFGLVGTWAVGAAMPAGRRLAVEYGGDVLVLSAFGAIPLSKLIIGNPAIDRTVYATDKIAPLFSNLIQSYGSNYGWALLQHPTDKALMIVVPQPGSSVPLQLVMDFTSRTWSIYRGLPILCAASWHGQLYFGTQDGRVCINTGYQDDVTLANPITPANPVVGNPIAWSVLPAFRGADKPTRKVVRQFRWFLLTNMDSPVVEVVPRFNYDTSEPADTSAVGGGGGSNDWDSAIWDESVWGADYAEHTGVVGGYGQGWAVAPAIRGQAVTLTTLVGVDVYYEEGASP